MLPVRPEDDQTPSGMKFLVKRRRGGATLITSKDQPLACDGTRFFGFTMPLGPAQVLLAMLAKERAALSRYVRALVLADLERRGLVRPVAPRPPSP